MARNLNLRWVKGVPKDRVEGLEKLVRNSHIVLSRLREIINEDLVELGKQKETDYDSPSWAYKQAHENGKQEYARQMLSLLNFLERK